MDYIKNLAEGNKEGEKQKPQEQNPPKDEGGIFDKLGNLAGGSKKEESQPAEGSGGFMDKLNAMAGGGRESEKKEDALDKGVDWVQENVLGQGKQDNESAFEQAKDEQISDYIRKQYKNTTGSDFPVKDK